MSQLTGCDPTAGGCNPGVIPVKIGDPVPCPATTPKIFYRDAEAFFHIFQITVRSTCAIFLCFNDHAIELPCE